MAPVNWATTDALLGAALATATGDDATIGTSLRALLDGLGGAYDLVYDDAADAQKSATTGAYSVALAAWQASAQLSHEQADKAARYCESLELVANASSATPEVYNGKILSPTGLVPWTYPDAPVATASAAFTGTQAKVVGTVDLGTINYATLGAQTMSVTIELGLTLSSAVVSFSGVTTPAGVVAAIQAALPTTCAPYLLGTKLVVATVATSETVCSIAASGAAATTCGLPVSTMVGAPTLVSLTSRLPGIVGDEIAATLSPPSDGSNAHFKLTVAWGSYEEIFDNIDPAAPPSVTASRLLSALVVTGLPLLGSANLAGGTGGARAALEARIAAAAAFPATTSSGQASVLEAHRLAFEQVWAEVPPLVPWLAIAPIPDVGVSTDVPLTSDGRVDIYALEQKLLSTISDVNAWLAEVASAV